jgi:hypothetical protein
MGAVLCYLTSVHANFIHFGPISGISFILIYCLCMDIINLSYIIRNVILVMSTVYFKTLYVLCFISLILRIKVVFTVILQLSNIYNTSKQYILLVIKRCANS